MGGACDCTVNQGNENSKGITLSPEVSGAQGTQRCWRERGVGGCETALPDPHPRTLGTTLRTWAGCRGLGLCRWTVCSPSFWRTWL